MSGTRDPAGQDRGPVTRRRTTAAGPATQEPVPLSLSKGRWVSPCFDKLSITGVLGGEARGAEGTYATSTSTSSLSSSAVTRSTS